MRDRAIHLLQNVARHRKESLTKIASKAIRYATESTRASLALRECTKVGSGTRCVGHLVVHAAGRVEIGRDVRFNAPWNPIELRSGPGAELRIGDNVDINYGTLISAEHRVVIGNHVMIGNHCNIADTEQPGAESAASRATAAAPAAIEIGDGAWLAVRVTVLPGSKIGAGAVITAGSIVSGEIPPGVVAGGIPARVVRAAQVTDRHPGAPPVPTHGAAHATNAGHAAHEANGILGANGVAVAAPVAPALVKSTPNLEARPVAHRGTLISDFTIDELARQLALAPGASAIEGELAPFGQVVQVLMQPPPQDAADFAVIWTRPESAIPSFARIAAFEPVDPELLKAEVDEFCLRVSQGAAHYRAVFVPTWTVPAYDRGLGLIDARPGGVGHALATMNLRLMDTLAKTSNVFVLDAQRWLTGVGKNASSPKLYYLGKVPFHPDVFAEAAREIQAAMAAIAGQARKLLVLDLDDTLWGGIVGDVGWEKLRLGGHDGLGESFVDFQRAVKNLTRRGIVLAVVSKNEESTALEAIRSHPEMVLRQDDFVAHRINWTDKARNILDIANELNLGLQSVVFIDDNPVERARVREALPEVLVPEWPEDKLLYRSAFAALRCFDTPTISKEDAERTLLYAAEKKRDELQATVGSMDEWLKTLDIVVSAEPVGPSNVPRTVQLLNKTNQMNLSTRRLTEAELLEWVAAAGRALWAVNVRDKFGDAGLTGIVSVEVEGKTAKIVDFVLSCRVMGRQVEQTMVHVAVAHALKNGVERVEAHFLPTKKNKPCLTFWQTSGFAANPADAAEGGGTRFVWDAREAFALPGAIRLEWQPT